MWSRGWEECSKGWETDCHTWEPSKKRWIAIISGFEGEREQISWVLLQVRPNVWNFKNQQALFGGRRWGWGESQKTLKRQHKNNQLRYTMERTAWKTPGIYERRVITHLKACLQEAGITRRPPPPGTKDLEHTISIPHPLAQNTLPPAGTNMAPTLTT